MPVPIPVLKKLIPLTLAFMVLGGCALFRPAPPRGLEVAMNRTTLDCDEFGELLLVSVFDVKNPNDFDVEIVEIERALRLESKPLKIQSVEEARLVAARSEIKISARMTVRGQEIVRALGQQPEETSIGASFQLALRTNQRELDQNEWYTDEWQGEMPIMLPPVLTFVDIERESLSALQADLHVILELANPNSYGVTLRSLAIDLDINKTSFGQIDAQELDRWIPGEDKIQVKVSHSYRLTNQGREIYRVLAHSKDYLVEVEGVALLAFDSPLSPVKASLVAAGSTKPN